MRHPDHRDLLQPRQRAGQGQLDLCRVDVEAAGDEHVLLAAEHRQVALRVDAAEITGVEPTVREQMRRRFGLVEIALHQHRPGDVDGALFARTPHATVVTGDAQRAVDERAPRRAGVRLGLVREQQRGALAARLGAAVSLRDVDASRLPGAQHLDVHRAAPRDDELEARQIRALEVGVVHHHLEVPLTAPQLATRSVSISSSRRPASGSAASTVVAPTSSPSRM